MSTLLEKLQAEAMEQGIEQGLKQGLEKSKELTSEQHRKTLIKTIKFTMHFRFGLELHEETTLQKLNFDQLNTLLQKIIIANDYNQYETALSELKS